MNPTTYVSAGTSIGNTLAAGSGLSVGEGLFLFTCAASSCMLIFMAMTVPKFILEM